MTCGFPRAVCMPMLEEEIVDGTKSDEGGCRGTEMMMQTVAALLVIGGGRLWKMVVDEAMERSKAKGSDKWDSVIEKWKSGQIKYEELPKEWMVEQVPSGMPRIIEIFMRLTGGFILSLM